MRHYDDLVDVRPRQPVESAADAGHARHAALCAAADSGSSGSSSALAFAAPDPGAGSDVESTPQQFLWRGRLYVVRDVLAHWVETGTWWTSTAAQAIYGTADEPAGLPTATPPGAGPTRSEDTERQIWRVEASAGRVQGSGVYDLSFEVGAGVWRLTRALD